MTRQVDELSKSLPRSVHELIAEQLRTLTSHSGGALTIGLVVSILVALWSASGGVSNLITAVNVAYDEEETRGFVRLRLTSLALTLGAIVFVLITFGLVAVVPAVLDALPLGVLGAVLAQVIRWVLLLAVMAGSLAVLYRVAPDRDAPRFRWVSLGSVVAEINAETEHQTARDTTEGEPLPMGRRDASRSGLPPPIAGYRCPANETAPRPLPRPARACPNGALQ